MPTDLENRIKNLQRSLDKMLCCTPLSAYPRGFVPPAEALPFMAFASVEALRQACEQGVFEYGSELVQLSPQGSAAPVFRINVCEIQRRLQSSFPLAV